MSKWLMVFIGLGLAVPLCVIGAVVWFYFSFIAGTFEIRTTLPENFPTDIQIFRLSDAKKIKYSPAEKDKIVSSQEFVREPDCVDSVFPGVDVVEIQWKDIDATRDELEAFYKDVLKKKGITNIQSSYGGLVSGCDKQVNLWTFYYDDPTSPLIDTFHVWVEYRVKPLQLKSET
jgi:hypothetical protein